MSHLDKFGRAEAHYREFNRLVDWYLDESRHFKLLPQPDPQGRWHDFVVNLREQPDARFGLAIGDCLHNLRAALDHLIWNLVPDADRSNKTEFPIFLDRPLFYETIGKSSSPKFGQPTERSGLRKIRGIDGTPKTIIEDLQPFNQPQPDPLGTLHKLENFDKHRVLHTMLAAVDQIDMQFPNLGKGRSALAMDFNPGPVEDGAVVATYAFSRPEDNPAMGMSVQFSWGIFVDDEALGLPWDPSDVLPGLIAAVRNVIYRLSPYLP